LPFDQSLLIRENRPAMCSLAFSQDEPRPGAFTPVARQVGEDFAFEA